MKNWLPLVSGPALAIDRRPGLECFSWKFSSGGRHAVCSVRVSGRGGGSQGGLGQVMGQAVGGWTGGGWGGGWGGRMGGGCGRCAPLNCRFQMEVPPVPSPRVKSPPWIMKPLTAPQNAEKPNDTTGRGTYAHVGIYLVSMAPNRGTPALSLQQDPAIKTEYNTERERSRAKSAVRGGRGALTG